MSIRRTHDTRRRAHWLEGEGKTSIIKIKIKFYLKII